MIMSNIGGGGDLFVLQIDDCTCIDHNQNCNAFFQVATFADRPGYQRISSSLWKQREDYCAGLIQKAWHHHKLRNTEDHTDVDPQTGEDDDDDDEDLDEDEAAVEAASKDETKAPSLVTKTVKLPPINPESKHLIEVRSASEED